VIASWTLGQQHALAAEAARAPSVHNVQPARWRFLGGDGLALFRARERAIPVADPGGHDLWASLGAAWEGMRIALSRQALTLDTPVLTGDGLSALDAAAGCDPVARATFVSGATLDADADFVTTRRAWRGTFARPPGDFARRIGTLPSDDVVVLTDQRLIGEIAGWHDDATVGFLRQRAQFEELRSWLRLTPRDPRWHRDGLTADALALGAAERRAARLVMRWPVLRVLRSVGLDRMFASEAAQVRSAAALIAYAPDASLTSFEAGRRFYRLWLALERAGLAACPMSAVCDDPATRARVTDAFGLPAERRLRFLLRTGVAQRMPAASPRLPAGELLV